MRPQPSEVPVDPAVPPPRRRRSPAETLRYLRDLANPRYHFLKLREDFRASRHALENRDLETIRHDLDSLTKAFRGRMFACYFMVGPFGFLGILAGLVFQYSSGDVPFKGLLSLIVTVVVGNLGAMLGFQVIWAWAHRRLYADEGGHIGRRIANLWRDILPMQWHGIKLWATANAVLLPAIIGLVALFENVFPKVVAVIPIAPLLTGLEIVFVHATLIRLMGDLFEHESDRIAHRHWRPMNGVHKKVASNG